MLGSKRSSVATTLATRIRLYDESVNTASRMTNGYP